MALLKAIHTIHHVVDDEQIVTSPGTIREFADSDVEFLKRSGAAADLTDDERVLYALANPAPEAAPAPKKGGKPDEPKTDGIG